MTSMRSTEGEHGIDTEGRVEGDRLVFKAANTGRVEGEILDNAAAVRGEPAFEAASLTILEVALLDFFGVAFLLERSFSTICATGPLDRFAAMVFVVAFPRGEAAFDIGADARFDDRVIAEGMEPPTVASSAEVLMVPSR